MTDKHLTLQARELTYAIIELAQQANQDGLSKVQICAQFLNVLKGLIQECGADREIVAQGCIMQLQALIEAMAERQQLPQQTMN